MRGVGQRVAAEPRDDDCRWLLVDSTAVRATVAAAGAKKKSPGGGQAAEVLGRSRGGFGTKIHAAVNPCGQPVAVVLTGAEASDTRQPPGLIAGRPAELVIADRGYDAASDRRAIRAGGAEPCIPPRCNRRQPEAYDEDMYGHRNVIERYFGRLKRYRRGATRYDETAKN